MLPAARAIILTLVFLLCSVVLSRMTQSVCVSAHETIPAASIEFLGNPSAERYGTDRLYARNVWDLQAFHGRLYIGSGNSSNYPPASNAGPVDVWSFDPTAGKFQSEFVVDEEQIDRYRVDSDRDELLVPGHDPRESWTLGNLYRLRGGGWKKLRTLPGALHTFDLLSFEGALFAALGTESGARVARSLDGGMTWTSHPLPVSTGTPPADRAATLFTLNGRLYVCSYAVALYIRGLPIPPDGRPFPAAPRIHVWQGGGFSEVSTGIYTEALPNRITTLVRPVNFLNQLIYIAADVTNDLQWTPVGLYVSSSIEHSEGISLPPGEVPYDILVADGQCYVLTGRMEAGHSQIRVIVSSNLIDWHELLSFDEPTFARSFEILNGDFYFGLGCEAAGTQPETGNILRIRKEALSVPVP